MVEIIPFKGLMYNKNIDVSKVATLPYDVISDEKQEEYYKRSEHNFIRLILSKDNHLYQNAGKIFEEWKKKNILIEDKEDCIYVYSQKFKINGKSFDRLGFIALIKLEDLGKGILPHEKTLEKPVIDRLNLMKATKANLGQIFVLYDDREKIIDGIIEDYVKNKKEDIKFQDEFGVLHRLWKISDKKIIEKIKNEMQKYQCIIADGHHRYKTILKYKEEHPDAGYGMLTFVNSFHEGMLVLPTHRLIYDLKNLNVDKALEKIKKYFHLKEVRDVEEMISIIEATPIMIMKEKNLKNHIFGMYDNINNKQYILKLKDTKILDRYSPDKTDIYKKLDVNILHKVIFEDILGISEEAQFKGENITYVKSNAHETMDILKNKKYQLGFFINPPLMREVFLTARSNETMPQKSTYFYPKVYSGLVVYDFSKN